jgi:hypothetical protein
MTGIFLPAVLLLRSNQLRCCGCYLFDRDTTTTRQVMTMASTTLLTQLRQATSTMTLWLMTSAAAVSTCLPRPESMFE